MNINRSKWALSNESSSGELKKLSAFRKTLLLGNFSMRTTVEVSSIRHDEFDLS